MNLHDTQTLAAKYGFDLIVDDRRLTFREWVRFQIFRHGGDPRILVVLPPPHPLDWRSGP